MNERLLVLGRDVQRDLDLLDDLWAYLADASLTPRTPEDRVIAIAYRLHNLYSACENIFRNIAEAFENSLDEKAGWHAQLLHRMRLDLRPLRPAVIDDAAFEKLDELRRFRHLFRSAYGIDLDPERMRIAFHKAKELREIFPGQIREFLRFLQDLQSVEG